MNWEIGVDVRVLHMYNRKLVETCYVAQGVLLSGLGIGSMGGGPTEGWVCMHLADSLHCIAETNNILKQLCPNKNKF